MIHASATSLDVERKHQQDKRTEKSRVSSLATLSRNSILQRFLVRQRKDAALSRAASTPRASGRYMNMRALALQERPDLASRPRGKLRWEADVDGASKRQIVHAGDPARLARYMTANHERLNAEAKRIRAAAKAHDKASTRSPMSNAEWMRWVDANETAFTKLVYSASGERRVLSKRVLGDPDMPEADRIQPVLERREMRDWMKLLLFSEHDFFIVTDRGQNRLFFATTILWEVWGVEFELAMGDRAFCLPTGQDFKAVVRPLAEFADDWIALNLHSATLRAEDSCVKTMLRFVVIDVEQVVAKERPAPAAHAKADEQDESGVGSDAASSGASVVSDVESDLEEHTSASDGDASNGDAASCVESGDDAAAASRARKGDHVAFRHEYATFIKNPAFDNVIVRLREALCKPGLLGTKNKSKTLSLVDTDVGCIVLRAWVLWRMRQEAGFIAGSSARESFVMREEADLVNAAKRHVANSGAMSPDVLMRLRAWCPTVAQCV